MSFHSTLMVPLCRRDGTVRALAIIDADDAHLVVGGRWCMASNGYAVDSHTRSSLHTVLTGSSTLEPDHIDGDKLNNRRSNLRLLTHAENMHNVPSRGGKSSYRGVSWHKGGGKWQATVQAAGKQHHLGLFTDEVKAANAAAEGRSRLLPLSNELRSTSQK